MAVDPDALVLIEDLQRRVAALESVSPSAGTSDAMILFYDRLFSRLGTMTEAERIAFLNGLVV